jgi:hypothetical protein
MTLLLTLDDGSIHRKLVDAVELARAAAAEEAEVERVGAYVGVEAEDAVAVSHLFEAGVPGYRGWRWSVTVATADEEAPVTVSEVVLIPGPDALIAPAWVPWERRVQAGDLGVGDIFPTEKDDPRLVPAYLASDDPAVEEVAIEAGLGRIQVLSRFGREEAAARWQAGEYGPRSDMARSAQFSCGTCGFFVPLAGSMRGAFGVCTNDISPADGHAVNVEYGCGAHSEIEVEVTSSIPVAELVYDDSLIDLVSVERTPVSESAEAESIVAAVAESVETAEAEPAEAVVVEAAEAEPVEVAVAEPADAAVAEPVVAEPVAAESAEAESIVAAVAESVETAEAEPVEAVATEAEPVEAVATEVAEPVAAEAEPAEAVTVEATVAQPTEAEPVEAVVTEAVEAEPVEAAVAESAEAEPVEAEAPVAETAEAEPLVAAVAESAEAAAPEAEPVETADAEPVAAIEAEPVEAEAAVTEPIEGEAVETEFAVVEPEVIAEAEGESSDATKPTVSE